MMLCWGRGDAKSMKTRRQRCRDTVSTDARNVTCCTLFRHETLRTQERALFWYTQAATNGHPQGQRMLAELLESDNPEQAAHWYLQAAEQGLPHAMRALAGMHCRGVGVKPNVVEACNLLAAAEGTQMCCEASARDVTDCCLWVGQSYLNGESGVKKNVGKARKYLDAAAASGSETAKGILATHRAFKGK